MKLTISIVLLCLMTTISAQTIKMGSMTPPLRPEAPSRLSTWTEEELYAYENGLIEGVWAAAQRFYDMGDMDLAYETLQVLNGFWWQISRQGGMRAQIAWLRARYKINPSKFTLYALNQIVLMEKSQIERILQ